jgi:outer membrane protein OmpA-like peptidoglycan-associated protein/Flp pilus assembly protein TadD
MRNLNLKLVASVLIASALFTGCNALKKMKNKANTVSYEAKPNPLEVRGDSIDVVITGTIPVKYFDKKTTVELNPTIDYNGGSEKLRSYTLRGEGVTTGDGVVISKASGGTFTYKDRVPFKQGMEKAELKVKPVGNRKTKSLGFGETKVADGTLTTALSVQSTEEAMLGKDNYAKVVPVEKKGTIFFEIDRSVVRENQKKSADVKGFEEFIKAGNNLTGISISSYASPDGELRRNDKLSEERTDATYKFLLGWLKKMKVEQVNDSSFYKKSATAEDWDGLKQIVSSSDISDRDQIINIVSTVSDFEEREKEIKKLSSYKKLADDFLPKLRRSEVTLIATEKRKTDEEIKRLASSNSDSLSTEELLYAASMTEDANEKLAIYNKFSTQYANDWRGPNNVAYIYLMQGGKADDALKLLDKANLLSKDNAVVYNNMGVAYTQKKDYLKAESNYLLAKSFGANNNLNLGNLKVRQGDYNAALTYYGSASGCTYNAALAATLAGNYEPAKRSLDCAKQDAATFYLKAIVGARENNLDACTTNLTKAIREDASYRERAKADLEFKKFMETDAFKVAVK